LPKIISKLGFERFRFPLRRQCVTPLEQPN